MIIMIAAGSFICILIAICVFLIYKTIGSQDKSSLNEIELATQAQIMKKMNLTPE